MSTLLRADAFKVAGTAVTLHTSWLLCPVEGCLWLIDALAMSGTTLEYAAYAPVSGIVYRGHTGRPPFPPSCSSMLHSSASTRPERFLQLPPDAVSLTTAPRSAPAALPVPRDVWNALVVLVNEGPSGSALDGPAAALLRVVAPAFSAARSGKPLPPALALPQVRGFPLLAKVEISPGILDRATPAKRTHVKAAALLEESSAAASSAAAAAEAAVPAPAAPVVAHGNTFFSRHVLPIKRDAKLFSALLASPSGTLWAVNELALLAPSGSSSSSSSAPAFTRRAYAGYAPLLRAAFMGSATHDVSDAFRCVGGITPAQLPARAKAHMLGAPLAIPSAVGAPQLLPAATWRRLLALVETSGPGSSLGSGEPGDLALLATIAPGFVAVCKAGSAAAGGSAAASVATSGARPAAASATADAASATAAAASNSSIGGYAQSQGGGSGGGAITGSSSSSSRRVPSRAVARVTSAAHSVLSDAPAAAAASGHGVPASSAAGVRVQPTTAAPLAGVKRPRPEDEGEAARDAPKKQPTQGSPGLTATPATQVKPGGAASEGASK